MGQAPSSCKTLIGFRQRAASQALIRLRLFARNRSPAWARSPGSLGFVSVAGTQA